MKKLVLYIHGKGGSAAESGHFQALFPGCDVLGLDYPDRTPWEAGKAIREAAEKGRNEYEDVTLITNSIGAFFSMNAGIGDWIGRAYFISPIVDMERLIVDMMRWANVTEQQLEAEGTISTSFGEDLSWEYLCYVREHPIRWDAPTEILYGENDELTSRETIEAFAMAHNARLTVMANGEHWFHTQEQMRFLDTWITECESNGYKCIRLETPRLRLYPASRKQMENMIDTEQEEELKKAYSEMLDGCLRKPDQWTWYAMWMIEQKDGTPVGDLCFKGLDENGVAEIGYGIREGFRGQGYATEAVQAACRWALRHAEVTSLEAETDVGNTASQRVLEKCGFRPNGTVGEEGPRFVRTRS